MAQSRTPWKPGKRLRLHTPRYELRSLGPENVDQKIVDWLQDPEVVETLNVPAEARALKDIANYMRRFNNRNSFGLGVYFRSTGILVGFYAVYLDFKNKLANTNVVIGDKSHWGKSAVLETRAAILDFLFDTMGVHKVCGNPFARNFPAVFNYKAQGFQCEGVLRQHRMTRDGNRLDQLLFGILATEWQDRRSVPAARGGLT